MTTPYIHFSLLPLLKVQAFVFRVLSGTVGMDHACQHGDLVTGICPGTGDLIPAGAARIIFF